ncbi:MAG: thio(seleno)oxazole modification radical SAM maturase SbtM [Desulfobulbaceae bacterium]|nr:thio(seleno)oxazole modification radical SAM maturase SbtM [Desulfobulbaceae bacterium]
MTLSTDQIQYVYPVSSSLMAEKIPRLPDDRLLNLAEFLEAHPELLQPRPYLADLARIEAARYAVSRDVSTVPENLTQRVVNPNLKLIDVHWQGLPEFFLRRDVAPQPGDGFVLVWKIPGKEKIRTAEASRHDLLALKIITEQLDSRDAAGQGGVSVGTIDNILWGAIKKGLLIAPPSRIIRPPDFYRGEVDEPGFFTTPTFTLQWHITQNCDLHCRHCYDRSDRTDPELGECIGVLDQLYDFCRDHHVYTQVTFTGGNPLMYPHFNELYREATDRGFLTAILGNPMPRKRIEEILAIRKPEFYQVSLEGLRDHNDYIRGRGHFDRVLDFLDLLQELDIYSMVMLTLTRANLDQVLELAELLRDRTDLFTFNRLAMVGEGAELASVPPGEYREFLQAYLDAVPGNPSMAMKDNLLNILRRERKQPFFGGCAGRGCGAAFNFIALLPDGEVHACRKFPSCIGSLKEETLTDIYHGGPARQHRAGSGACARCEIRPVCGGCLAVVHGFGLDIFTARDPYCFI